MLLCPCLPVEVCKVILSPVFKDNESLGLSAFRLTNVSHSKLASFEIRRKGWIVGHEAQSILSNILQIIQCIKPRALHASPVDALHEIPVESCAIFAAISAVLQHPSAEQDEALIVVSGEIRHQALVSHAGLLEVWLDVFLTTTR